MSKLVSEELRASIKEILRFSSEEKKRGFVETVELQVRVDSAEARNSVAGGPILTVSP